MELKFSVRKPAGEKKGDLFCLFKGYRLLVKIDDGCARIPLRSEAGRVRLSEAAIRDGLLYLGSLGGVSCYTAEVAPGAEAPQGMDFCELRELFALPKRWPRLRFPGTRSRSRTGTRSTGSADGAGGRR